MKLSNPKFVNKLTELFNIINLKYCKNGNNYFRR